MRWAKLKYSGPYRIQFIPHQHPLCLCAVCVVPATHRTETAEALRSLHVAILLQHLCSLESKLWTALFHMLDAAEGHPA